MGSNFWRKGVFTLVMIGCGLFVVLTVIAMFFYPGGNGSNPADPVYSFIENFFSDLGRQTALNGSPNPVASIIFLAALTLAGLGMALFFLAFEQFFRSDWLTRLLAWQGSGLGILSAAAFVGVAFSPVDLSPGWHVRCVTIAFRLFPLAVFCYLLAMLRSKYRGGYTVAFAAFLPLLVGYVLVREFGPGQDTHAGLLFQVVSQKVIVYASILSVMIQGWGAQRQAR